eukprot:3408058-Pyramimonas_sp.AAC.1
MRSSRWRRMNQVHDEENEEEEADEEEDQRSPKATLDNTSSVQAREKGRNEEYGEPVRMDITMSIKACFPRRTFRCHPPRHHQPKPSPPPRNI